MASRPAGVPAAAIRLAEGLGRIDLLVTDVIMPGMNGRDLAERISAGRRDLKVLYISGYTESVIGEHGILPDEIQFLQKPFSISVFARRVQELLGGA